MNMKKKKNSFFRPSLFQLEDRLTPSAYVEPIVISSNPNTRILDLTFTAHQSQQPLETLVNGSITSILTSDFLTYAWQINDGNGVSSVNGVPSSISSGDTYPGPTLKVQRGDILRIRMINDLDNLTIDTVNPEGASQLTPPSDPPVMEEPINNHVHGLHISPTGSSDNVLLSVPAGMGFVYEYHIAANQPDGLYWMHNHRHYFSDDQVARGMSNMLIVGASDSNISQLAGLPSRTMALQYQNLADQGLATQYISDYRRASSSSTSPVPTPRPLPQLTINALMNPTIDVAPGQTEVWSIVNMTPQTNARLTLKNASTNTDLPIIIVAQDGIAYGTPVTIPAGTPVYMPSGARYSILVTAGSAGQNVQLSYSAASNTGAPTQLNFGVNPPDPNFTGFINLTSTLSTAVPSFPTPTTLTAERFYQDLSVVPAADIAVNRSFTYSQNPSNFQFFMDGETFPNPPIYQQRLNTVEEWVITNVSTSIHPLHIHVNHFQVMSVFSPLNPALNVTTPQQWYQDDVNVPAAFTDPITGVVTPGKVVIRIKPLDFTGAFVNHCHILHHEDLGMMALVNTQPEIPIYVTGAESGGGPRVSVFNSLDNSTLNTFFAFEESFTGGLQTAVADVNNDGISDLIVGAGVGGGPRVIVFNGATNFTTTLLDFFAFASDFRGGVDVAGGDFNADGFADIVVGAGPGGGPQVNIFDGRTGNVLTQFFAYDPSFRGGVTVAVGDIDGSGFNSVITGAGAGGGSHVKTWQNSRFFMADEAPILPGNQSIFMNLTGQFMAYESAYTGGVNVAVGLNAGVSEGGFYRILTGTITGAPRVTVWGVDGHNSMDMANSELSFELLTTFFAFDSTETSGVRVASVAVSNGSDFLAATGSGTSTRVKRFSLLPGANEPTLEEEFSPFTAGFDGGASLGGTGSF